MTTQIGVKCGACEKTVYPFDPNLNIDGRVYHKKCAKCKDCGCLLDVLNFGKSSDFIEESYLLCKLHYEDRYLRQNTSYRGSWCVSEKEEISIDYDHSRKSFCPEGSMVSSLNNTNLSTSTADADSKWMFSPNKRKSIDSAEEISLDNTCGARLFFSPSKRVSFKVLGEVGVGVGVVGVSPIAHDNDNTPMSTTLKTQFSPSYDTIMDISILCKTPVSNVKCMNVSFLTDGYHDEYSSTELEASFVLPVKNVSLDLPAINEKTIVDDKLPTTHQSLPTSALFAVTVPEHKQNVTDSKLPESQVGSGMLTTSTASIVTDTCDHQQPKQIRNITRPVLKSIPQNTLNISNVLAQHDDADTNVDSVQARIKALNGVKSKHVLCPYSAKKAYGIDVKYFGTNRVTSNKSTTTTTVIIESVLISPQQQQT